MLAGSRNDLLQAFKGCVMKIESKREFQPTPITMSTEISVDQYLEQRATPERLRKGSDFRVFEGIQRLSGPLSALHRSGDIEGCHVAAANRWYRDYVLGVEGARDPEGKRSGKAGDVHSAMLSRIAACGRHRGVREALGFCAELRLRLLRVEELTFSAIAEKLMPKDVNGRKKIGAQMIFLLEQLAEHYDLVDKQQHLARRSGDAGRSPGLPEPG